ncbi:MAG: BMC domain-containing protein [Defluviitaleaceae bacterium]|nr:BMC domain-containing protein [Defluviitaleaceae bacterium]
MDNRENETNYPAPALGFVEIFGIVYVLQSVDAMLKAAAVELVGFENVASGYISVVVKGDTTACKEAVTAGVTAAINTGAEVYSSVVITSPHKDLCRIINRYSLKNL